MKLTWKIYDPSETFGTVPGSVPGWLAELRALRALEFNRNLAVIATTPLAVSDVDPLDHLSYHLVAHMDGKAIGCSRLSVDLTEAALREFFGGIGFTGLDDWPRRIWTEAVGSRWVVAEDHRSLCLAQQLVGGAYALARHLGIPSLYSVVGTRLGQDKILARTGGLPAKQFGGLVHIPRFNDQVYMMAIDLCRIRPGFMGVMEAMHDRLGIEFMFLDERTAAGTKQILARIAA